MKKELYESLMVALDESEYYVSLATGIRQKYIDAGWTPIAAERAAIKTVWGANA